MKAQKKEKYQQYFELKQTPRIKELCLENLKQKYGKVAKNIEERLSYELEIIRRCGAEDRLLLLLDLIEYAKKQNIMLSPGRGTNAGSLVLYALGVTNVNPLRYNLFFERFLNPEKLEFPVVYLDAEDTKAYKLVDYIEKKYGKGKVALAASYDKTIYFPEVVFVALKVLSDISNTIKVVKNKKLVLPDIDDIPLNDHRVYTLIASGETDDVFQFASTGMRKKLKEFKPKRIEDLSLLIALYRPGGIGTLKQLIKLRKKRSTVKYLHQKLEPILKETYGLIAYQEQVMQISVQIAGYTPAQGDKLRYDLTRRIPVEVKKQKCLFICGASTLGIQEKKAEMIFKQLERYVGFTFNKSHSISYAILGYQTAYLKYHYRKEYMGAVNDAK